MATALMAVGLVFAVEGLVYALAPTALDRVLEMMRALSHDQRRAMGLASLALGIVLVWVARALGA